MWRWPGTIRFGRHPLGGDSIHPFAGTGREDVQDGPREEAAFAQPSGLTSDGRSLFVADSEGSAIRRVPLDPPGAVETLAGTSGLEGGQSLFAFGDVDGKGAAARLQHPLGITYASGRLYVADSYNHKIKVVDPSSGTAETLLGTGQTAATHSNPRNSRSPAASRSPAGRLYIADTNNHALKVADALGQNVQSFEIDGLSPPPAHEPAADEFAVKGTAPAALPAVRVVAGDTLRFDFSFKLPAGYKLNKEAPITCRLRGRANRTDRQEPIEQATPRDATRRRRAKRACRFPRRTSRAARCSKWPSHSPIVATASAVCASWARARWTVPVEVATTGRRAPPSR